VVATGDVSCADTVAILEGESREALGSPLAGAVVDEAASA
jgi:hypothetical protein